MVGDVMWRKIDSLYNIIGKEVKYVTIKTQSQKNCISSFDFKFKISVKLSHTCSFRHIWNLKKKKNQKKVTFSILFKTVLKVSRAVCSRWAI